jgi:Zn-finger nucleic acid-binding protein
MVEIKCPLCAEAIDLGMAEEGEYECPYCEDVFHWKPKEFRDIENLQCPQGCGQLSKVLTSSGAYYKCHKCKGSLLNAKYLRTILKDNSDRVGALNSLLEHGVPCDLDCPTCGGKMVEIKVYYEPPDIKTPRLIATDRAELGINLLIDIVAYGVKRSKHNYENLTATIVLEGCGDCGSFWFDKGEIDKIRKADDVYEWAF